MKKPFVCIATLWLLLLLRDTAYAYLDPGTGSMMLQIVLGGLAGLVVILKLFWHRLLALFGIGPDKENDSSRTSNDQ
jgi:hypothetical protein